MKRKCCFTIAVCSLFLYHYEIFSDAGIEFPTTESCLTAEPTFASFDEVFLHANDLFHQEQYAQAAHFYKKALEFNPQCAHTWFNLGQAYYLQQRYDLALSAYKNTVKYKPTHHRVYAQIGKLFFDVKQYKEAIIALEKAVDFDQTTIELYMHLSRAYCSTQAFDKALETVQKGLSHNPKDINLTFELANVYNHLNKLEEALALYKTLDSLAPNNPSIIYNIAFTLKKLGKAEESLDYYNKVIELNPHHKDAWFSRGLAYLVLGDFEKGWQGYEWRYHKPEQGCLRSLTSTRWDGTDLTDKIILLHAEQGLGDTFQFIRYAQLIKNTKNPKKIIAAVQKPLVTLMRLCPYIDEVIAVDDHYSTYDVHAPLMSLPYILKTTIETIPCTIPYIFGNQTLTQQWKNKLAQDINIKVGICIQGNQNYATPQLQMTVALKSVGVEQLAPICRVPGVSIYSLQKMSGTDQFNNLPEDINIIVFDSDFDQSNGRFMDTVAVIENLDLIITVDTSICHLAAALGKPTWVMLPNPADWRWMQNKTDSPWYPTIRLFKQPTPGDWESMIKEVAQELGKFVESKKK